MTADYLYTFSRELIRKNQSAGFSSLEFENFWHDAQCAYEADMIGRFNAKNNGKEGANTGLIQNEIILTKLSPFTLNAPLTIVLGMCDKPDKFIYKMALRINSKAVIKINKDQMARMMADPIDPPSEADGMYYYTEYGKSYSFFPSSVTSADIDYLVVPDPIKWGFGYDADGRELYDSALSKDPLWDDISCLEITKRMLIDLGVSFKDGDFANFGQTAIVTGE